MVKGKRIALIMLLLFLIILCCGCDGDKQSEVIVPTEPQETITQNNDKLTETQPDYSQTTDNKVKKVELYISYENGDGFAMNVPEKYFEKIELETDIGEKTYFIKHKETRWIIATIKIANGATTLYDNAKKLNDNCYAFITYGELANDSLEAGKEINTIRRYCDQMLQSINLVKLEPQYSPDIPDENVGNTEN